MSDYKALLERYGDAIHEDPENYLDELHGALQNIMSERDRLRVAIELYLDTLESNGSAPIEILESAIEEAGDE